jgi:sugar phosphate isomerase/epimerase
VNTLITLAAYGDEAAFDLEEQLNVLEGAGIRFIELRKVEGCEVIDLPDSDIMEIKRRLDERGFRVHSISSPIGKSEITEDFTPNLQRFIRAVQLAKFFTTPVIRVFSFYYPEGENPWKYYNEVLNRIGQMIRIAETEGVILLLENEKFIFGNTGGRVWAILQSINSPHLRLAFDPANFVQSQVVPMVEAYPCLSPFLSWVQIKDALLATGENVLPGEGDGQVRELLSALRQRNYTGFLTPEGGQWYNPELLLETIQTTKMLMNEAGLIWH